MARCSGCATGITGVTVRENSGADVGTEPRLNFIEGSNVTLTITDDTVNDEIDITIASSGGSSGVTVRENSGANVGTQPRLNLIEGSNVTLTVTNDPIDSEIDIIIASGETVRKNSGANVGTRPRLNFIEGSNVTLTIADDAINDEIDITIASSGGGASGAWTAYTPVWTSSGVAPSIGNGTLRGAYRQDGKTLFIRFEFIAGSTTTFGTGEWRFSMPGAFTALSIFAQSITLQGLDLGTQLLDGSALIGERDAVYTTFYDRFVLAGHKDGSYWQNTAPITWATGDRFAATGVIEIA